MNCRELVNLLLDFVAEDLSEEQREEIREHICSCPPCAVYAETYRVTIRLTRQLPPCPIPPHLEQRLRDVIAQALNEQ